MTEISSIYDQIVTRMKVLYPDHTRLSYARDEDIERNNDDLLRQGWGLAVLGGENTERLLSCQRTERREFQLVFTRQKWSTDHDVERRSESEKALLEDGALLADALINNLDVDDETAQLTQSTDAGIQDVFPENRPYFLIRYTVFAEIFRNIT